MRKKPNLTRCIPAIVCLLLCAGWLFANGEMEPVVREVSKGEVSKASGEHVVKVLRTTNKAQVLKYVPRVYDFVNANPHEVINYFTSALATEEGGAYSFVAPDGKSGKILVICPEHQIPYFDKLAKNLDRAKITSSPGSKYIYYRLKHRSCTDKNMLNILFSYGGELPVIPALPVDLQADLETNSLLLYDAPTGSENAKRALEEILDLPTPQVELQVKIYEVQVNNDGTFGLDYTDWKNGPGALLLTGEFGGERFRSFHRYYRDQWSRTGGYYIDYPSAYFDFLVIKNKARVVTENTISAMTGTPAAFASMEQYLYFSKKYPAEPDSPRELKRDDPGRWNREIDVTISSVSTGITLAVIPIVGTKAVDIDLSLSVDNVTGYADKTLKDGTVIREAPIVNTREFSDRINVPLGKEVLVGGLTRERVLNHTKKIPILGSLPVIGWLFGGESARTNKTMVVAVIKPVRIENMRNLSDDNETLISEAKGEIGISVPETKVGFDQWLLDTEK